MASADKSERHWRAHHNLPDDYNLDAILFYGTWPHENKVEPHHLVPLRAELDKIGAPYTLRALGKTSLIPGKLVNYLDHAYDLRVPDSAGDPLNLWFVPVEGTRLAGEYVDLARTTLHPKKIVVLGMCAGLLEGMCPGEFVMPTKVLPNDTGQDYNNDFPDDVYTRPDSTLKESLRHRLLQHDSAVKVWETQGLTNEALRRQTTRKAEEWAAAGFGSVDMETGLIFGAAVHPELGPPIPAAALLYIIDSPRQGTAPSEAGHLLGVNAARALQYQVALEEIRGVPLG
jgi:purine-nucleoside phosphorylase